MSTKQWAGAEVVYFATALGPLVAGRRARFGPEHPAPAFGLARRKLDWLDSYGHVERWTRATGKRQLVAKREQDGTWWENDPLDGWRPLQAGDIPGMNEPVVRPVVEPAPEPAAAPAPPAGVPAEVSAAAAANGHMVTPAPLPLPSPTERWSCTCSAVALRLDGRIYGTALTTRCTAAVKPPSTS